ncbi:MAG: GNAT family N-acetyltransferase [Candidatus Riflebacteria bacterium]|jgi:ribosomal protein S18 acetylase RimI-like enzyme|nr:GNAT family N-acetyltransferase [Candidatus Riflebacteria bacterium]
MNLESDNKYQLSKAGISDLADVIEFEKKVLNDSSEYSSVKCLKSFIKSINAEFLLIKYKDKICAYGLLTLRHFKNKPSARILKIAVDKTFRRLGLASRLISELEKYALKNSMTGIFAEVRESNTASLALFQKFGYKEARILFGYYSSINGSYDLENGIKLYKILYGGRALGQ